MKFFKFFLTRLITFFLVVLIGITTVFFVPRFMPSDPIENMIGRISARSTITPEEIQHYREALNDTFGLSGSLAEQYFGFLKKLIITHDFGPSLTSYPTPVMTLIQRALPWTFGLLIVSTILAWIIGNLIGLLAGYKKDKIFSRILEGIAITMYPIPYYIFALILIMVFAYIIPIFPLSMTITDVSWSWKSISTIIYNSILPALSLVFVGFGWWVISTKTLSSSVAEEEYVNFARLKGLKQNTIMLRYVAPNVALPQITILALQVGAIFNGALITEILFGYPGLGTLMYTGIIQADYNLIMATISISIFSVTIVTFIIDILYPLLDPRIRHS